MNSHAEALVSKTSVSTNSTTRAYLVQPPRIELGSSVLQTAAMTTSAKVAWCFVKESNFRIPLVRRAVYHLPNEAWVEPGNRTLSTCFTDRCATTTLGTTLERLLRIELRTEDWKSSVLPLNYSRNLERNVRIELTTKPWQGFVLPLN